CLLYYTGAYIV
nr:immunoglobulin light chain junction region [Macaca mulatta]